MSAAGDLLRRPRAYRVLAVAAAGLGILAFALLPRIRVGDGTALGLWGLAALFSAGFVVWSASRRPYTLSDRLAAALDLFLFNLLLLVLVLELVLRAYVPFSSNPLLLPETSSNLEMADEIRQRLERRKGVSIFGVPFNSMGFRDDEFEIPKPTDVFRIVALADSFGVNAVVPDSHFHMRLLEKELEGFAGPRRVEVANLGISATGPQHYLTVLEEFGVWLEPDLVAVYLFLGNDFSHQVVVEPFRSRWDVSLSYRIASRLGRVSRVRLRGIEQGAEPEPSEPDYVHDWRLEEPTFSEEEFLTVERTRARVFDTDLPESHFEVGIEHLRRMAALARRVTGRPLLVVVVPDELQVNDALHAEVMRGFNRRLDSERPVRVLAESLKPAEAVIIDLLPALREAERETGRVYHLRNTHWNANGNRAVAREVARQLRLRPELGE
jgi:hypothetical protein